MRRSNIAACALLLWGVCVPLTQAQYARPKLAEGVGLDQKLNAPVPLDLVFRDESGQSVPLRTYFGDNPVVLEMVYFNCPGICPMIIHESVGSLKRISLEPGRDYNVVIVSFDPADTPKVAAETKAQYASTFGRPSYNAGFHFLTGDQQSIDRLAKAIGWRYHYDVPSKQFVHAAGIMVATPEGKLSRYFYGIDFAPPDLRMSLVEAAKHRIGNPVDYVLLFCLHYDASLGKYTLTVYNILKLAALITIAGLALLVYLLMRNDKKYGVRHAG